MTKILILLMLVAGVVWFVVLEPNYDYKLLIENGSKKSVLYYSNAYKDFYLMEVNGKVAIKSYMSIPMIVLMCLASLIVGAMTFELLDRYNVVNRNNVGTPVK